MARDSSKKPSTRRRYLLLEILAIFVGITASFWVDDWREERQDEEIFERILGEVYYNVILDDWFLARTAADNNLALSYASALAFDDERPPPDELARQLGIIFGKVGFYVSTGGLERLTNASLAVPTNEIQLTLDNIYSALGDVQRQSERLDEDLRGIGARAWWSRGAVECSDVREDLALSPSISLLIDVEGQAAPIDEALGTGPDCRAAALNRQAAQEFLADEDYRTTLLSVINTRRSHAANLLLGRQFTLWVRLALVGHLPDVGLPVEGIYIAGSATEAGWDALNAPALKQVSANEWAGTVTLGEGAIKFLANRGWTINWGAKPPWVASGVVGEGMFSSSAIDRDEVFPENKAYFTGMDIPVLPGRYKVRFNTQTFEYRFENLD